MSVYTRDTKHTLGKHTNIGFDDGSDDDWETDVSFFSFSFPWLCVFVVPLRESLLTAILTALLPFIPFGGNAARL